MSVLLDETSQQALAASNPVATLTTPHAMGVFTRNASGAASGDPVSNTAMTPISLAHTTNANAVSRMFYANTNSTISSWDLTGQQFDGATNTNPTDTNPAFAIDTWYHLFLARLTGNAVRLYLNGSVVATATAAAVSRTFNNLSIGRLAFNSVVTQHFRGYVAEPSIWGLGSMTAGQVDSLASDLAGGTSAAGVTTTATLLWYRTLIAQANGEAHEVGAQNLTAVNAPTFASGVHPTITYPGAGFPFRRYFQMAGTL